MGAVWMRALSEVRARRRALLAAALLCGLFGAVTLVTFAGARRAEAAYPRFLERNRGYDVLISDSSVFADVFWKVDFDLLAGLPYAETSVRIVVGGLAVESDRLPDEVLFMGSQDPRFGREINRPLIAEGRLADPSSPDEITVPYFADGPIGGLRVGDEIRAKVGETSIGLRVVGRTVIPGELPPQPFFGWPIVVTSAFLERHQDGFGYRLPAMMIRFEEASDVDRLLRDARGFTEGKVFAPQEQSSHTRAVQGSANLQATAFKLLAAFVALTGIMIMGQVLARETTLGSEEGSTLRALGFDRRQLVWLGILRVMPVAFGGALIAMGLAWLGSPFFPRGSIRAVERSTAPVFDGAVLLVGTLAIVAIVVILVIIPAWRAARMTGRPMPAVVRPSQIASLVAAAGMSVPAVAGVRLALERGRGKTAVPVVSSMVVVSIGIATFVAAATFGGSLQKMVDDRQLQGKTWDQVINTLTDVEQSAVPPEEMERLARARGDALASDPDIEALAFADAGAPLVLFSRQGPARGVPILGLTIDNVKGSLYCPVVEGREPSGPNEVVLGVRMIKALDIRLDPAQPPEIQVALQGAEEHRITVKVVGRAVIPPLGNFGEIGYGIMFGEGGEETSLVEDPSTAPPMTDLLVRWRDGADPEAVIARYRGRYPDVALGEDVSGGRFADVVSFGGVEAAPVAVGAVLATLGAAALAHVLVTAIRRRRRDVAILKTVGFVRGQARRVVAWQATITVLFATLIGMPLGIVVGRTLWNLVANGIGVLPSPKVEPALLWALIPAVVALGNLIAAPPGRSAARTQPALVLRSE